MAHEVWKQVDWQRRATRGPVLRGPATLRRLIVPKAANLGARLSRKIRSPALANRG